MKLKLNDEVCNHLPGLRVAGIVLKNIDNSKKISALEQLLRGACAQKKKELKGDDKGKILLEAINKAKIDKQTLPEIQLLESDLNKIERRKVIETKNTLHDICHYFVLHWGVPVHGKDLDEASADLEINFTELKKGKRAQDVDFRKTTSNAVIWLTDIGSVTPGEFESLLDEMAGLVTKYCGGEVALAFTLNCSSREVDLLYISAQEQKNLEKEGKDKLKEAINREMSSMPDESQKKDDFIKDKISELILGATQKWLKNVSSSEQISIGDIKIDKPASPDHGDYSANIALILGKKLNKPPHEVATQIAEQITKPDFLQKIDIAGPGFINLFLSETFLKSELDKIQQQGPDYGKLHVGAGKTAVIEYSSPNIAKPLAVNHLLSTIIGQTIADLFRAAGYNVVTLNWLGDWGTQFGKLLYAYKNWGDEEVIKQDPLNELLKLYVQFHDKAEENPLITEKGREEFKKLEEGDEENLKLFEWIRKISIDDLEKIYSKFGIKFTEYWGERSYVQRAKEILDIGKKSGVFIEGEGGAFIADFDDMPPYVVQKSDGTTLYSTRDIAGLESRIQNFDPNKIIIVAGQEQKLHFQQFFAVSQKLDILPDPAPELKHISFGRMQLPEGKKMSTRKGNIILVDKVLEEAISRTSQIVSEKSKDLSEQEKESIAERMAVSAIKYNIISQNRETNILFEWDRMLSLEGNSGPYLQYAYARARSIERKARELQKQESGKKEDAKKPQTSLFSFGKSKKKDSSESAETTETAPYQHPREQALMRLFPSFKETVRLAAEDYRPNALSTYLYEVAKTFNSFYNDVPVLSTAQELREARLNIVKATAQILKNGLTILGIDTFERM